MSKPLALIAAIGLGLSLLFFALAFLVAGGQIFDNAKPLAAIRPLIDLANRKEWRWDGGDTLAVNGPVELNYQPEGPPHVTVSGPADLLRHVRVGGGQISSDIPHPARAAAKAEKLQAVVGGMPIRKFVINGRQHLQLGHIDQDSLDIRINDGGSVSAEGRVGRLNIVICGPGHADLGRLEAQNVKLMILGDGDAVLAPHQWLFLTIVGNGVVRLATQPASIQKTIFGSGRVIDAEPQTPGTPPPPPTPPPMPNAPVTASGNQSFLVTGSDPRKLGHFAQGDMQVTITGSGSASADGKVDHLTVMVSGSGGARLGALSARQVAVTVAGSGDATVAPQDDAQVTILGSGNVYLASRPRRIERNIMGSGRVIEQK